MASQSRAWWTLTDLAGSASGSQIEAAIRAADARGLSDPDALRAALGGVQGRPGAGRLRRLLDRRTFRLTDSELEGRFLRLRFTHEQVRYEPRGAEATLSRVARRLARRRG